VSQAEIGIGAQVVCVIDDWIVRNPGLRYPYKGEILTVRDCVVGIPGRHDLVGLLFVEIVNPARKYSDGTAEQSFESGCFRPVRKTDISVFTELLETPPLDFEIIIR
jgi:hypothetical protein